ncbi:MAG TPA: hypothetical protein VK530_12610, partial [Candidatus Acidoferrum sp.]|nr:hypothetical protein [Candidatus Acidoferrum sp.]
WPTFGGKRGNTAVYDSSSVDIKDRPLNLYVANAVEVFHCPRDKGDTLGNVNSAWDAYGNSYLMQTGEDSFRIKYILSLKNGSYGPPVKTTSFQRTDNKLVAGDWVLHGNRPIADRRTQWHSRNARSLNIFFLDGHTEYFTFPKTYGVADAYIPANPTNAWY